MRAGTGRVEITPPVGGPMQGYASRTHGSAGIHDRLLANAIVLDDGCRRIALVTCDLIGLDHASVEAIRKRVSRTARIDPDAVMVNCSHTHGGPATGGRSYVKARSDFLRVLERQVAASIILAAQDLREATLHFGTGSVRIGVNRRERRQGGMVIGANPEGPIDPQVGVLRIDDVKGRTFGVLFNHSCHGTTLGGDNYMITADYVGYARKTIESVLLEGKGLSSFLSGAGGNINPHPRGDFDLARAHGITLGAEALKTSAWARPLESPALSFAREEWEIPLARPPPENRLRAELVKLEEEMAEASSVGGRDPGLLAQIHWRREMLRRYETGSVKKSMGAEAQALGIGPLGVVGLPGEVFVEIGIQIKEHSPFSHNMVAGYTNDNLGYIPTSVAFEEGGYEPNAYVYMLEQRLEPSVEEAALSAGLSVLASCLANPKPT